jgi:hypothetical protein
MELSKAVHYIRMNRNRRVEQLQKKESPFRAYPLQFPDMKFDQTYHMGCLNARLFVYAASCNALLRHIQILSEHSLALAMFSQGKGQPIKTGHGEGFYNHQGVQKLGSIDDLVPSINTLIYCLSALNISSLVTLEAMLEDILGKKYLKLARDGYMVDIHLRNKIHSIVPQGEDVEAYLLGFIWRLANNDPETASKIAFKMGLTQLFSSRGYLYRGGENPPGSGPTQGGNGPNSGPGGKKSQVKDSTAALGLPEPQKIENYFESRQSQFGLPSNIHGPAAGGIGVNNQPPQQQPFNDASVPKFNIDPNSVVSKSVMSIDASFNQVAQ